MQKYTWLDLVELELQSIETSAAEMNSRVYIIKEYLEFAKKETGNITFEEWKKLFH